MRSKYLLWAVALLAMGRDQASFAADQIRLSTPVYSATSTVAQNVRDECRLPEQLSEAIVDAARRSGVSISTAEHAEPIRESAVLQIEIVDALNRRSGGPGGHNKFVTVSGALTENGAVVARFQAHRRSGGGAWGWMKSACTVFARIDQALGEDIARWLRNPVDGAHLGDPLDRP